MRDEQRTSVVLASILAVFLMLAAAFLVNKQAGLWGRPAPLAEIPEVDPQFTNTATARVSLGELIRAKADLSDFDCYVCHEKGKPPPLRFDAKQNLIVQKEHETIVMGHGRHQRNNNCFNCHNETNLELFQTRDGRQLKLVESTPLCGSCHGPTYRDWEAGVHGRTSGYWDRKLGPFLRQDCVACHNPHAPAFPSRKPAPGPHPLHVVVQGAGGTERSH
jgi:hypothetical protein